MMRAMFAPYIVQDVRRTVISDTRFRVNGFRNDKAERLSILKKRFPAQIYNNCDG
jgi:hypothetical protein